MKNYLLLILVILSFSCSSTKVASQEKVSDKAKAFYLKATESLQFGDIPEALGLLQKAIDVEPRYMRARQQVADIYLFQYRDYDQAVALYEEMIEVDKSYLAAHFFAAKTYMYIAEYDKASEHIDVYLTGNISDNVRWQAETLKASASFAKEAIKNPVPFEPQNLGPNVNSEKSEYFPSITADNGELYFTVREGTMKYPNEDIYISKFVNGAFEPRLKLAKSVNSDFNEGAHSIVQSGRYLLFASNRFKEGNEGKFDIFISKRTGENWLSPKNIGPVINTRHWESQPVLSADGKTLFFVSDRPGGKGESDIYMSTLGDKGGFGDPVNLGSTINTPGEEQRPFIHPDGKTLYFASTGHPGMGGSDLFVSTLQEDGSWSTPKNLGYPINSSGEELGMYVAADGKTAYISSEREDGYGDMDIYSFDLPEDVKPEIVVSIKGRVFDMLNGNSLKANVKIYDLVSGDLIRSISSEITAGTFLLTLPSDRDYAFETTVEGYLPYSESLSLVDLKTGNSVEMAIGLKALQIGKEIVLKNVFFNSNSYELKEESKTELNRFADFMIENSTLKFEVGGHTDDVGTEESNQLLSQNRAKSVMEHLISKGVQADRLTFKGYGETVPVGPNDSEENRAKNRRTAFKLIQ